jgi:hypothetical protein
VLFLISVLKTSSLRIERSAFLFSNTEFVNFQSSSSVEKQTQPVLFEKEASGTELHTSLVEHSA